MMPAIFSTMRVSPTTLQRPWEEQRNRVLRNAAGGMCHYLNTHLAAFAGLERVHKGDIKSLDRLAQLLPTGDPPKTS